MRRRTGRQTNEMRTWYEASNSRYLSSRTSAGCVGTPAKVVDNATQRGIPVEPASLLTDNLLSLLASPFLKSRRQYLHLADISAQSSSALEPSGGGPLSLSRDFISRFHCSRRHIGIQVQS